MDFKQRASQWGELAKDLKKQKSDAKDLMKETTGVQGSLLRLEQSMGALEDASETLSKKLVTAAADAEKASDAITGWATAAKKVEYCALTSELTEKDLDELTKAAKELKAALAKFDKKTD